MGPPSHGFNGLSATPVIMLAISFLSISILMWKGNPTSIFALQGYFLGDLLCRQLFRVFPQLIECVQPLIGVFASALPVMSVLATLLALMWRPRLEVNDAPSSSATLRSRVSLPDELAAKLTSRELEAINLLLEGLSSSDIAERMGIKASSVRGFQQRAYK